MKNSSFSKKRVIHRCIVIFIVTIITLIAVILTFKYNVEGEKNLPFNLKEFDVISTAESNIIQNEDNTWKAKVLQNNDVFFTIEKNNKYKKEEAIKKISFENFVITKTNDNMEVNIYRPTVSVNEYIYSDEYKIEKAFEYTGSQTTNIENLEINNQGGKIGFSIATDEIGEYTFAENEKLPSDGRLLKKTGVKKEDIEFKVSFDFIIETETGNKFKSNINMELPTGNILKNGVEILKDKDLKQAIFKRF